MWKLVFRDHFRWIMSSDWWKAFGIVSSQVFHRFDACGVNDTIDSDNEYVTNIMPKSITIIGDNTETISTVVFLEFIGGAVDQWCQGDTVTNEREWSRTIGNHILIRSWSQTAKSGQFVWLSQCREMRAIVCDLWAPFEGNSWRYNLRSCNFKVSHRKRMVITGSDSQDHPLFVNIVIRVRKGMGLHMNVDYHQRKFITWNGDISEVPLFDYHFNDFMITLRNCPYAARHIESRDHSVTKSGNNCQNLSNVHEKHNTRLVLFTLDANRFPPDGRQRSPGTRDYKAIKKWQTSGWSNIFKVLTRVQHSMLLSTSETESSH
jgi:hypothetical protein